MKPRTNVPVISEVLAHDEGTVILEYINYTRRKRGISIAVLAITPGLHYKCLSKVIV